MKTTSLLVICTVLAMLGAQSAAAAEKHLFYVHGCCVKDGMDPKVPAYEKIIKSFKDDGFKVNFELRFASVGDNDAAVQAHAKNIADQVQTLIAKGTAPDDITVAGYSLGSMTALVTAGHMANPKVNVVLLAGCPVKSAIKVNIDYTKVKGRILSIYDAKDEKFGSCKGKLPENVVFSEVVLNSGEGHAVFRLPDEKHMKLWKEPTLAWTKGK